MPLSFPVLHCTSRYSTISSIMNWNILKFVEELGFDKEIFIKDFGSEALLMELQQEIKAAEDLDIDATPTMIINGEKVVGVKPYYQLKEILVNNGAKKR